MTSTTKMPKQRSAMTTFSLWICLAFVFSTSIKEITSSGLVEVIPSGSVAVRVGDRLRIMCRMGQKLEVCRVEIPNEKSMILKSEQNFKDPIEYYGNGTDAGQCGVQIARVKENHDGIFNCWLTTSDSRTENQGSLRIIVAKPPQHPEIYLNPVPPSDGYRSGTDLEISCVARAGRPAANVSLYLDDEPIGYDGRHHMYGSNSMNNNTLAMINATRNLNWRDNGKIIRCVAHHIALDQPMESKRELQVAFAPQPQEIPDQFGYVIGRPGVVNVTIYANPRPNFVWSIGGVKIQAGDSDSADRLQTSSAVELGKGAWSVQLTIDPVEKSDTEKDFVLEASNVLGTYGYTIVLSTSAEPAGVDLDAGSIIGIAVGALVLILLVFLIIFARATGRWCFAGGSSTRNIGESSDTESAGRYSRSEVDGGESSKGKRPRLTFSKLFKRNKDKVSGADTDTVRTVVTLDDDKVQSAESATESHRNNPSTEGGIVYAELDLTQQQQGIAPRRISDDKTEYAEIVYAKTAEGEEPASPEK